MRSKSVTFCPASSYMDFVQQYRSSRYSLNSFKRSALHDLSIGQGARAAIVQGSSKDGFDVDEEAPYNKVSLLVHVTK